MKMLPSTTKLLMSKTANLPRRRGIYRSCTVKETVDDYCNKILDISYEFQDLSDPITNKQLVSKYLGTLTSKLHQKVTAITTMKVVGALEFTIVMNDLKMYEICWSQQKLIGVGGGGYTNLRQFLILKRIRIKSIMLI